LSSFSFNWVFNRFAFYRETLSRFHKPPALAVEARGVVPLRNIDALHRNLMSMGASIRTVYGTTTPIKSQGKARRPQSGTVTATNCSPTYPTAGAPIL
jgi:hypothetical protein